MSSRVTFEKPGGYLLRAACCMYWLLLVQEKGVVLEKRGIVQCSVVWMVS